MTKNRLSTPFLPDLAFFHLYLLPPYLCFYCCYNIVSHLPIFYYLFSPWSCADMLLLGSLYMSIYIAYVISSTFVSPDPVVQFLDLKMLYYYGRYQKASLHAMAVLCAPVDSDISLLDFSFLQMLCFSKLLCLFIMLSCLT